MATRYQLSVRAENLPSGFFRSPNPYAVATITGGPKQGTELGRTETIEKTVSPDWVKTLFLEAAAAEYVPITITIFNDRGIGRDKVKLAEATFEATEVFQSAGHMQSETVQGGIK